MARLTTELWVAAHRRRIEIAGASAHVARRGAAEAGAVLLKLVALGADRGAPNVRALARVATLEGAPAWSWLVGPEPAPEAAVDARLARQAAFDADLWILEIEDREGRHFLDEPVLDG